MGNQGKRELTLKCKLRCYLNPWINLWALALVKGSREPHEAKKNSFDLGGNRTHDLRIRSTVTLPTELQGRTEKVGDELQVRVFYSLCRFLLFYATTNNIGHLVLKSWNLKGQI